MFYLNQMKGEHGPKVNIMLKGNKLKNVPLKSETSQGDCYHES